MEQIKKGYRKTEVGLIPEEWTAKRLKEIANFKSGYSITSSSIQAQGPYECYGGNGLRGYTETFTHNGAFPLIGRQGALCGNINYVEGKFFASEHAVVVSVNNNTDSKWMSYVLNRMNLNRYSESSAQPGLTVSKIDILPIAYPPTLTEQKAIATALSDVDELITKLEKLIEKKKAIKQGAMQQLLTPPHKGGKRLEGFSGEWVTKELGEVCEIRKGQLITESTKVDGDIPVIAGGKRPAYYHNKPNRNGKTITISGSGANAGYVSFHVNPIFASDCSTIEESDEYCIEFILYFLQLMQNKLYKMQTGGAQPHIHPSDLSPIKIGMPSKTEQESIASIIRDMDLEIEAYEKRSIKAKLIKQGMMQELLTGKTRLI